MKMNQHISKKMDSNSKLIVSEYFNSRQRNDHRSITEFGDVIDFTMVEFFDSPCAVSMLQGNKSFPIFQGTIGQCQNYLQGVLNKFNQSKY